MREPLDRYFQIGVVAAMADPAYSSDALEVIRRIVRDPYFQAIELNPIPDVVARKQVAELLRQSHMTVSYGAHGLLLSLGLNPNDTNETGRRAAESALFSGVDQAAELGAERVAFLSGRWTEEMKEQQLSRLCDTTQALCSYAKSKGIVVELELFDQDIAKRSLLGPAALAERYAAQVRSVCSNFGLMVDMSHFPMCREETAYILRLLRPYITHFHMGNTVICDPTANAYGDEHPRFGFPHSENDTGEVVDFLTILQREGFFCRERPYILSFEVKPWQAEDPEIVLSNAKRVLDRAWAML